MRSRGTVRADPPGTVRGLRIVRMVDRAPFEIAISAFCRQLHATDPGDVIEVECGHGERLITCRGWVETGYVACVPIATARTAADGSTRHGGWKGDGRRGQSAMVAAAGMSLLPGSQPGGGSTYTYVGGYDALIEAVELAYETSWSWTTDPGWQAAREVTP